MSAEFEYKMAIILRGDLEMSVGKMISQACHAALESSEIAKKRDAGAWKAWYAEGARKIVVKARSFDEFQDLEQRASKLRVAHATIVDRGLTELPPGTTTALGVGPAAASIIDKVTGSLPLLK